MADTLTYREALRAFADGKTLERPFEGEWAAIVDMPTIMQSRLDSPSPYRIRQATININGVEVPEPCMTVPEDGTRIFTPAIGEGSVYYSFEWEGIDLDMRLLKRGLIHLTKEAAQAHARALILASGGQV